MTDPMTPQQPRSTVSAAPRRFCLEWGCDELAGTRWSPYWCSKHDEERRQRISDNLEAMAELMGVPTDDD